MNPPCCRITLLVAGLAGLLGCTRASPITGGGPAASASVASSASPSTGAPAASPVDATASPAEATPVRLTAADGVTVHAWHASTGDRGQPIVLLFHQAGSNHAEYDPIAPALNRAGFSTLALDQRSGGTRFGADNLTARGLGRAASYRDALLDLKAAVAWARTNGYRGKIIAWGSSYSAALVFLLAADTPEVGAVLAFSPDEYLGPGPSVHDAAARVRVPVFVTSAPDDEVAAARAILGAVPGTEKRQYVPKAGVHGASTLRADANPEGAADNLAAVLSFLESVR